MKQLYFNKKEFLDIVKLLRIDPELAIEKEEAYISKYPLDKEAYVLYSKTLTSLRRLDEAKQVLKKVKHMIEYEKNTVKLDYFFKDYCYNNLKILILEKKYEEAVEYMIDYEDYLTDIFNNAAYYYCLKQTGKLKALRENAPSYLYRQIIDYHYDEFLEHIQKHLHEYTENDEIVDTAIFDSGFPVKKVLNEIIDKYIPSEKGLYVGLNEDLYIFRYDNCGRDTHKMVNYFKIYTFHDTKCLITMCPSLNCEKLPYVDLNYLKEEDISKVKRLSQIEKFNLKYKR